MLESIRPIEHGTILVVNTIGCRLMISERPMDIEFHIAMFEKSEILISSKIKFQQEKDFMGNSHSIAEALYLD